MSFRCTALAIVCIVAAAGAGCGGDSPTAPSSPPPPPASTTPPPPAARGDVQISVAPNPVPFSGAPITDAASCAASPNTWFYEQTLKEVGGAAVTFTGRVDRFDGSPVNTLTGLSIVVPANGSVTIRSRWCSVSANEHNAQTSFTGTDASGTQVSVTGPSVRLLAR